MNQQLNAISQGGVKSLLAHLILLMGVFVFATGCATDQGQVVTDEGAADAVQSEQIELSDEQLYLIAVDEVAAENDVSTDTETAIPDREQCYPSEEFLTLKFSELDINQNDVIEKAEWLQAEEAFERLDTNGDESLSNEEFLVLSESKEQRRLVDSAIEREARFEELDENADGTVSREEWDIAHDTFLKADTDANSFISAEEFLAITPIHHDDVTTVEKEARFQELDTDQDGQISQDEWEVGHDRFAAADIDGDELVSLDEFLSLTELNGKEIPTEQKEERFVEIDSDEDSYITQAEWDAAHDRFAVIDTDKDELITKEEFLSSSTPMQLRPKSGHKGQMGQEGGEEQEGQEGQKGQKGHRGGGNLN